MLQNGYQEVMRTLKTTSELDARTDAGERGVTSTLRRLADRLPACTQELRTSEVCARFLRTKWINRRTTTAVTLYSSSSFVLTFQKHKAVAYYRMYVFISMRHSLLFIFLLVDAQSFAGVRPR